jgi:hypothetical protein
LNREEVGRCWLVRPFKRVSDRIRGSGSHSQSSIQTDRVGVLEVARRDGAGGLQEIGLVEVVA